YNKSFTEELKYDLTSQINETNLIKLGFDIRDIEMKEEDFTVNDNPQTGFQLHIDPLTAFDHNAYDHTPLEAAGYVQDKVEVKDFVLNAGVRYDYFNSRYYVPTNYADPMDKLGLPFDEAYRYVDPKVQLSPRLGVAFPISDVGSLHASFGEFFQMPDLQQVYANPGFKVTGVWQSYIGNADINPEQTTAYEIGIQQELMSQLTLDATTYYKDIRNLSGVTFFRTFDQVSYAEYSNANYGNVWGITVELRLLQTGLVSSDINYTYQVAEGNGSDPLEAFFDAQSGTEATRVLVPLSWDQTHVLNWVLNITGDSWGISTISRFNSGNPFTPTNTSILVTDVQLENLARRLAQFNMDLQAYKNFNFGIMNAQLFLRVENVFDQTLPEYFPILTPQLLAAHIPEDYLNSLYDFDYDPSTQPMPRLVKLGITLNY
ncbi:MAG: TonB-dependent receptor, partial [Candidatus Kryptoniota bacterium]